MQIEPLQMTPVTLRGESHLGEIDPGKSPEAKRSFGEYLADALKETNRLQLDAEAWDAALAAGRVNDVSQVVVAGQKAEIALQLTLQLRNRAVSAYQEIARMQV